MFNEDSVLRHLRRVLATNPSIVTSPDISDDVTIVNIETFPLAPNRLALDLDNGMTICLDFDLYPTIDT